MLRTLTLLLLLAGALATLWQAEPTDAADASQAVASASHAHEDASGRAPAGHRTAVGDAARTAAPSTHRETSTVWTVTVYDADAAPVADARVRLLAGGTVRPMSRGDAELAAGSTDLDGRCRLTPVAGAALVVADKPGVGRSLSVPIDDRHRDVNVELRPEALVRGRVLDGDGRPAAHVGVRATLQGMRLSAGLPPTSYDADSDRDGRFAMRVAPEVDLRLVAADGARRSLPVRVATTAGSETEVELHFPGAWSVSGSLVDADGHPSLGYVRLERLAPPTAVHDDDAHDDAEPAHAEIDADGRFRLDLDGPGRFVVQAFHDGAWTGPHPLELDETRPHADVQLRLPPTMPIAGRVRLADGTPVAGARVRLVPTEGPDSRPALPGDELVHHAPVGRTDPAGGFAFDAVGAGCTYDLVVAPDRRRVLVAVRRHGVRAGDRAVDVVVSEREARGAVLTLELATAGGVRIDAVDASVVTLRDDGRRHVTQLVSLPEGGRLRLPPMPLARPFAVLVRAKAGLHAGLAPAYLDGIELQQDETRRVLLPRAAELSVRVLGRDGRGRSGLRVQLVPTVATPLQRGAAARTDDSGCAKLAGLAPGEGTLRVGSDSRWLHEETLCLRPGDDRAVSVALR
ncbi:MAG: carboxypeptidase-like regulatory domain-containing protein [Planctomycetota bacterium]